MLPAMRKVVFGGNQMFRSISYNKSTCVSMPCAAFLLADGNTTMWKLSFRESDVLALTGQNST